MKKGFTLVELSIVLVIIGLLVGGILVAQSLIDSAKIGKAVSQLGQYDIAVQQFKSRFNSLPGDSNKLPSPGDNNGLIEEGLIDCCGSTYTTEFKGENRNFWPSLQTIDLKIEGINDQMSFLDVGVGGTPVRASGVDQNVPQFTLGNNTGVVPFVVIQSTNIGGRPFGSGTVVIAENIPAANYYFLANFDTMTSHGISNAGNANRNWAETISVENSLSLDTKIDDSFANTGRVLNGSYFNSGCTVTTATAARVYDLNSANDCALLVRMNDQ